MKRKSVVRRRRKQIALHTMTKSMNDVTQPLAQSGVDAIMMSSSVVAEEWSVVPVEERLGYPFREVALLEEALTHSSYPDHNSYQRLEFVGDAALGLAVSNFLYLTNPDLGPGNLSILRAANISTEKLARVAVRHGFYRYLRHSSLDLDQKVREFTRAISEEEEDLYSASYGGCSVKAPKVLADIVEAIAAAVYIDCNFNLEMLWKVFRGLLEPIVTAENHYVQPVTTLYDLCQKQKKALKFKIMQKGSMININVLVDGELLGSGSSEQKEIAKLNAARGALQKLCRDEPLKKLCREKPKETKPCVLQVNVDEKEGSKSMLNEFCSKNHWPPPRYTVEQQDGPAHDKRFIISVRVETKNDVLVAMGDCKARVKDAENSAASRMLYDILKTDH